MAWGTQSVRLLDLVPVARGMVIEGMPDGVMVIDSADRIADINPAALKQLRLPARQVIGRQASEVLKPWVHLTERYRDVDQDCFVAFKRVDGRALNADALKVLLQA